MNDSVEPCKDLCKELTSLIKSLDRESLKRVKLKNCSGQTKNKILHNVEKSKNKIQFVSRSSNYAEQLSDIEWNMLCGFLKLSIKSINAQDYERLYVENDKIKPVLRGLYPISATEVKHELELMLEKVSRISSDLELREYEANKKIEEASNYCASALGIYEKISKIKELAIGCGEEAKFMINEIKNEMERVTSQGKLIHGLVTDYQNKFDNIEGQYDAIYQNINAIQNSSIQLIRQEEKASYFENTLDELSNKNVAYEDEVIKLIEKARDALKLTTSSGLSAAFSEKYSDLQKSESKSYWIIGSGAFLWQLY